MKKKNARSGSGLAAWAAALGRNAGMLDVWQETMAERYSRLDRLGLIHGPYINTSLTDFLSRAKELAAPFHTVGETLIFPSLQPERPSSLLPSLRGRSMTIPELVKKAREIAREHPSVPYRVTAVPSLDVMISGNITVGRDGSVYAEFMQGTAQITRSGASVGYTAWTLPYLEKYLHFSTDDPVVRHALALAIDSLPRVTDDENFTEHYRAGYYEVAAGRFRNGMLAASFFDYRDDPAFQPVRGFMPSPAALHPKP